MVIVPGPGQSPRIRAHRDKKAKVERGRRERIELGVSGICNHALRMRAQRDTKEARQCMALI